MYERRNGEQARRNLKRGLETWTFHRLPLARHEHLQSTNRLERFNPEIKRRTWGVRIFPEEAGCRRRARARAAETPGEGMEARRGLNADPLRDHRKRLSDTPARAAGDWTRGAASGGRAARAASFYCPVNARTNLLNLTHTTRKRRAPNSLGTGAVSRCAPRLRGFVSNGVVSNRNRNQAPNPGWSV
jgi:hypothetical protein